MARPLVIGDPAVLEPRLALAGGNASIRVQTVAEPEQADPSPRVIPCLALGSAMGDLSQVVPGVVDARAGRAAHAFLTAAARLALAGRIDAITTLPLNKLALHQSGVSHPGHTEILAEFCGVAEHAMMLYLETKTSEAGATGPRGAGPGWVWST